MPPYTNTIISKPESQGHTPTDELHPRKADEDTFTQHKLHTQAHSKHPHRILPSMQHDSKAKISRNATSDYAHKRKRADTNEQHTHNGHPDSTPRPYKLTQQE
ncbi:hypothetical protein ATANTOWER_010754, partial [Ataeniobius toweri]|nr:hypothetical protein [Ataeniobius toweri]